MNEGYMEVVPVSPMSGLAGFGEVDVGMMDLYLRKFSLERWIRLDVPVHLSFEILFHCVTRCRTDTSKRVVALKCLRESTANEMLKASFDRAQ
jgi:hypothetical protein